MMSQQIFTEYLVRLNGKVDLELAGWFPELSFYDDSDNHTILEGKLPDQSALLGILIRLHNLNLQILSVEARIVEKKLEE